MHGGPPPLLRHPVLPGFCGGVHRDLGLWVLGVRDLWRADDEGLALGRLLRRRGGGGGGGGHLRAVRLLPLEPNSIEQFQPELWSVILMVNGLKLHPVHEPTYNFIRSHVDLQQNRKRLYFQEKKSS